MPLLDPLSLFDTPTYQRFGNLFWPDRFCMAHEVGCARLEVGVGWGGEGWGGGDSYPAQQMAGPYFSSLFPSKRQATFSQRCRALGEIC